MIRDDTETSLFLVSCFLTCFCITKPFLLILNDNWIIESVYLVIISFAVSLPSPAFIT